MERLSTQTMQEHALLGTNQFQDMEQQDMLNQDPGGKNVGPSHANSLEAQQMLREAHQRIQGDSDNVLCKEGVSSTVTTLTSDSIKLPHASHGELLNDTSTTTFGLPSTAFIKGSICITGPFSIGDHHGHQNQAFLLTSGNLDCTRSSEDPSKWRGLSQGTSERLLLQADDQRLYHQDRLSRLDLHTMRLIRLSQHIERYLNGQPNLYHGNRIMDHLDTMLKFLHENDSLRDHLKQIPDSVALVRCDIPLYNPSKPECKEIIEQVVVEHYRSPWTMQWGHRVRVAQVQNPHLWFMSLANGPERSDEFFFDDYNPINHETQSVKVPATPPAVAVTPVVVDLHPDSDTSMDVDIQPLDASVSNSSALSLPGTSLRPPGVSESVQLAQPRLSVITQESLDTSDPSLEPTNLDTTQGHGGIDSSDDNERISSRSFKPFRCPYPGCTKSYFKKFGQRLSVLRYAANANHQTTSISPSHAKNDSDNNDSNNNDSNNNDSNNNADDSCND
ncbi:hypothetical protein BGZ90_001751 [Linnemannia elongata]|nr:hypothetical protein BGZ90_001751 [Linnemannia elongata]